MRSPDSTNLVPDRRLALTRGQVAAGFALFVSALALLTAGATRMAASAPDDPLPTGTITLVKDLVPSDDPGTFDLYIDDILVGDHVGDGYTSLPVTLETGTYNVYEVAEDMFPPTSLDDYETSATCVEDTTDGPNPNSPITGGGGNEIIEVPVEAGDEWTCTETNIHKGTITVVKDLFPSDDPGRFDLFVNDILVGDAVGDDFTSEPLTLEGDEYRVVETAEDTFPPTSLDDYETSVRCVEDPDGGPNPNSPITGGGGNEIIEVPVEAGDEWTCTETNIHKGTITVVKDLFPSDDPGRFDLFIDGDLIGDHVGDGYSSLPVTLETGSYNVYEVAEDMFPPTSLDDYETSATCVEDPDGGQKPTITGGGGNEIIEVPVEAGDEWTCTETNTRATATLTVIKHVVNNNGGSAVAGQWTMTLTGGSPSPASFAGSEAGTPVTVNANTAYSVTESGGPAGYTESSSAGCVSVGGLAPGAVATCTFTNDDQPVTLTVIKHVVNDSGGGAGAANFTMTVTGTAVPGPNASNSTSFPGAESPGTTIPLRPGTYSVTESGPAGYVATTSGSCTTVAVALGDTKTCTLTNDDQAPVARILFTSTRDGNFEIYSMNADGTGQTRLTNNLGVDGEAAWSPDRSKIVFSSSRDGDFEIYTMNANGTGVTRLTNNNKSDLSPAWSSTGKIAFSSDRDGNLEIYRMNADGTGQTRLTTNSALDGEPAWSPDGTKLVFSSSRTSNGDIYRINADGTGLTRLTTSGGIDLSPAWSADGTKIAFSTSRDGNVEIYRMNADGTAQTRLTTNGAIDAEPAWSPDGTKLAFTSSRTGLGDLYSMNVDGTGLTRLTTSAGVDLSPAWK